jgi:glucose/arabinose dehydrogenase
MRRKIVAAAAAAVAAVGIGTPAAAAASAAPPPMPVSTNGHPVQLVASGLHTPTSFAFGSGEVFVGDGGGEESGPPNGGLFVVKNGAAVKVQSNLRFVAGLAWHNDALYISGAVLTKTGPSFRLLKFSDWNGTTFETRQILFIASKRFQGFNGIGFGANGRLYVGVDVGLLNGNDNGPRSLSPHLYQILTFKADGSDMQVFANGMRQPWQMAFTAGSNSPYVTDLGQDQGANYPRDAILHVQEGQDYGFPSCNEFGDASKCAGFAQPWRTFKPHTDLMGIALNGGHMYLSSFLGLGASGPGGEVFQLTLGDRLKPLMKGFVAPTVGLGVHNSYVYVGELTGQVFRVKV